MKVTLAQVEHVPAQARELRGAQAVPAGEEDHGGIAVAVTARPGTGGRHQPLDLVGGEVLTLAEVTIEATPNGPYLALS